MINKETKGTGKARFVEQLKRVASFQVQSIESNNDNDWNENEDISENCFFNKRIKILW